MPKKVGRPPVENPKNIKLQIRVSQDTMNTLDECAEKLNSTRSDIVRKGIERIASELKVK
ncbi:ribbon-helix-helix protein, CopG family [Clostridium sp. 'deep sea']|uniref:ribbon-helix-helix protein, CopG family n=1 Tax=Clostridium sp. 'deep sea' TaxID=2779445 RepID=UPI0018966BA5|nr:ribbon-helix-helix protein, CopG family [Clostridium sp. 'deep sea']QOR36354.1 ribbon-helix-helix protein, CopG family [Clostridium sp. 'deep sea']